MNGRQLRLGLAAIGVGAVIGMGITGVTSSAVSWAQPEPANTGQTVTQTKPPSTPSVGVAKPALKGPAPLPPEEQGLPG
jgi:hypothetical protein